jgi:SP family myo-inositol transporter-like MFS transporter 13
VSQCNVSWFVSNNDSPDVLSNYCPNPYAWLAILGLCLYLASFAFGLTSMPWIINSEIFPTHLRATGNSLATATNWICNLGVSLSFLTLTENITEAGTFWLYGGISIVATVYTYYALPETKGKSLEEIEDIFIQRADKSTRTTVKHGQRYEIIQ